MEGRERERGRRIERWGDCPKKTEFLNLSFSKKKKKITQANSLGLKE